MSVTRFGLERLMDFVLHPLLDRFWKGTSEKAGERASERYTAKFGPAEREYLWGFIRVKIRNRDEAAAEGFERHQKQRLDKDHRTYPHKSRKKNKRYAPGDENHMNNLLARFLTNSLERWKEETTVELFVWLGHQDDERFDAFLAGLDNDGFEQFVLKAIDTVVRIWEQTDKTVAGKLGELRVWLETHWEATQEIPPVSNPFAWLDREVKREGSVTSVVVLLTVVIVMMFFAVWTAKLL